MTDIQANVIIQDRIDKSIETKLNSLATQSLKASANIDKLNNSLKNLSVGNINAVKSALQSLANINPFKNINTANLQLINSVTKSQVALAQANAAIARSQLAMQKYNTEQARTAQITSKTADAQAIAAARVAEIKKREQVAEERLAATKALTAQRQARLNQILNQGTRYHYAYGQSLGGILSGLNSIAAASVNVMKFIDFGDTYQRSINKLTLVTKSAEDARNRLYTLSEGALASYGNLESYTALYTRLDMALKNIGGTASEAIAVTQTLSKTVSLAGLTSAEASSALLQISQAFNKGKLDGDEFRTVMETMPPLADAIARELSRASGGVKILRGDLLNLAPKGKITAEVMKRAVISMAEEIDARFAKLTPTVAMELENLRTKATMYFGQIFKDTGVGLAINEALRAIGDNLERITKVATVVGAVLGTIFVAQKVVSYVTFLATIPMAFKTLRAEVLATSNATNIANLSLRRFYANLNAATLLMRATPFGLMIAGATALSFVLDKLFEHNGGFLPSLDQETAKLNDYISRLDDINKQMETMSSIALERELLKSKEAYTKLTQEIEKNEKALRQNEKAIQDKKNANIESAETDLWVVGLNTEMVKGIDARTLAKNELTAAEAKGAELSEKAESLEQNRIKLLESQISLAFQLKDRQDELNKIIDEGTTANKHSQAEIDNAKVRVAEITNKYGDLNTEIKNMIQTLANLSKVRLESGAEFAWFKGLQEAAAQTKEAKANLQLLSKSNDLLENIALDKKIATAKGRQKSVLQAEKWASSKQEFAGIDDKGLALPKDKDGNFVGKSRLDTLKQAKIEELETVRLQAESNKHARTGAKLAESKAKQHQKALDKLSEYKQGLIDENKLLSESYQSYERYHDLYKLKAELQTKGVNLSNKEIDLLKQQIDLNNELKSLVQEINRVEEASLTNQRRKFELQLEAIEKSNLPQNEKQSAIEKAYSDQGVIGGVNNGVQAIKDEYALRMEYLQRYHEQAKTSEMEFQAEMQGLAMARDEAIYNRQIANLQNMGVLGQLTATAFESFTGNATDSIMSILDGTKSIQEAMGDLAMTILTDLTRAIVQMGVKWLAQQAMQLAFGQTAQATQMASASALLGVYTPLATAVSLASFGSNSAPAMAGMSSAYALGNALALAGKRKQGGVINAGSLYQVGEGNAPEMFKSNSGKQYMISGDGGRMLSNNAMQNHIDQNSRNSVGNSNNISITIENYGTNKNFETQNDNGNIRIIVTDILREESPDLIQNYMESSDGQEIIAKTAKRNI